MHVIAPEAGHLHDLLRQRGLEDVRLLDTHELVVSGATTAEIGEIAGAAGIFLHELSTNTSSLEVDTALGTRELLLVVFGSVAVTALLLTAPQGAAVLVGYVAAFFVAGLINTRRCDVK